MRYSKRYIFFTIVLFVFILAKFNNSVSEFVQVEPFRGARLQSADWNPLIAASINDEVITLNIGSRTYTSNDTPLYMDNELQLMVPVSILRDSLNCSAHIYDEKKLSKDIKAIGLHCPNCGSPITSLGEKSCSYCGTAVKELIKKIFVCNDIVRY